MAFLQRALLIYMALAVTMCFAAPQYIFNSDNAADSTVLGWFNIQYVGGNDVSGVSINNNTVLKGDAASTASETFTSAKNPAGVGGGQSILGFLDPVFQVWNWVKVFFKMVLSPIIIFTGPAMAGAPAGLSLILAIPLVFMFIVGLIVWIRSGYA